MREPDFDLRFSSVIEAEPLQQADGAVGEEEVISFALEDEVGEASWFCLYHPHSN